MHWGHSCALSLRFGEALKRCHNLTKKMCETLCLTGTQKFLIEILLQHPVFTDQASIVTWWSVLSVITPICIIVNFVVAAVLVVVLFFVYPRFSFLLNWIYGWPTWTQKIMFLTVFLGNASSLPLSPFLIAFLVVFLALVWPSSLPSAPNLCQALGTVEFRSTHSTCLFHSSKLCLHL